MRQEMHCIRSFQATLRLLTMLNSVPDFRTAQGFEAKQRTGDTVTEEHVKAFEDIGVLFKGPLTIPVRLIVLSKATGRHREQQVIM